MNKNIKNALLLGAVVAFAGNAWASTYDLADFMARQKAGPSGLVRSESFRAAQEEAEKKGSEAEALQEFRNRNAARTAAIKAKHGAVRAEVDAMKPAAFAGQSAFTDLPQTSSASVPALTNLFTDSAGKQAAGPGDLANPTALFRKQNKRGGGTELVQLTAGMPEAKAIAAYNAQVASEASTWAARNAEAKRKWEENEAKLKAAHLAKAQAYADADASVGADADAFAAKFGTLEEAKFNNPHSWNPSKATQEVRDFYAQNKKTGEGDLTKEKAEHIAAVLGFAKLGGDINHNIGDLFKKETKEEAQGKLSGLVKSYGLIVMDEPTVNEALDFQEGIGVDADAINRWLDVCESKGNREAVEAVLRKIFGGGTAASTNTSGGNTPHDPALTPPPSPALKLEEAFTAAKAGDEVDTQTKLGKLTRTVSGNFQGGPEAGNKKFSPAQLRNEVGDALDEPKDGATRTIQVEDESGFGTVDQTQTYSRTTRSWQ